jgi:hypothetical protein
MVFHLLHETESMAPVLIDVYLSELVDIRKIIMAGCY